VIRFLEILMTVTVGTTAPASAGDLIPLDTMDVTPIVMPVADSPRGRRYIAAFDAAIEATQRGFDNDRGLISAPPPANLVMPPDSISSIPRHQRKAYINSANNWYYRVGRLSASAIGSFARAYSQPLSRYYRDQELLRAVRNGFDAYIAVQRESGEPAFSPLRYASIYGTHEMAWRLEDFIAAYACVRDDLTADERARYRTFLIRSMEFLRATPCDHACNRGMSWAAVMAMCWLATGEQVYLDDAQEIWKQIRVSVFPKSGQVYEGHGPDPVYSPVSYEYLYRYVAWTGDTTLLPSLSKSTRWLTETYTDAWFTFAGVGTRYDLPGTNYKAYRLLLGFEDFVNQEPAYAQLAESVIAHSASYDPTSPADHGGTTWIMAAYHHNPDLVPESEARLAPYVHRWEDSSILYFTAGLPEYRTMVTLRGTPARKGLQTWAATGSPAFLAPSSQLTSTVRAWDVDLAGRDVSNENDWKRFDRAEDGETDVSSISARHGRLTVTYILTDAATLIVHSLGEERRETVFAGDPGITGGYRLDGNRVVAERASGELRWWQTAPSSTDNGEIIFQDTSAVTAFSISSGEVSTGEMTTDGSVLTLEWRDKSGSYRVRLNHGNNSSGDLSRGQARVNRLP
jgi:hypothetical protein